MTPTPMRALVSIGFAAAFSATASASASLLPPSVDARFGLVGTGGAAFASKFGFRYYTLEGNYSAGSGQVFSSVNPAADPAAGFSVVREVAKLNVRTDSLGQTNAQFQAKLNEHARNLATWYIKPSWMRGAKPAFVWYRPDAAALVKAESLHIVETIRREKARSPAITGTVWEIGNEPNLFPAITPAEYAAIFANYHRVIKAEDPDAVVAMGSLFLPEPCEDLKAKLGEELESKMRAELEAAGYYATLNSMGVFNSLVTDMKNLLLSRMLALPAREYLRQVLAATAARPDIVTLHVYPFDDRAPFQDSAALRAILDTTAAGVKAMLAAEGASAPLWVTEFGNIEQALSEAQVADRTRRMIGAFMADSAFAMWFHYKSTGVDDQFALFSSGPAPLTRLAKDPAFAPASGDFSCAGLNAVGLAYWKESHGGSECADPETVTVVKPPLRPAVLNSEGSVLKPSVTIDWGWETEADAELQPATLVACLEIYRDTAGAAVVKAEALKGPSLAPQLPIGSGLVYVRVRYTDGAGRQTPWSSWRVLSWEAPPTSLSDSPMVPTLPSYQRPGIDFDIRGRFLPLRRSQL